MGYLISGHKGFIGRNLMEYLSDQGLPVYSYDYNPFHFNADTFIHLSAATNVRASISNPHAGFVANCARTLEFLTFAREHQFKKFIFASSAGVTNPKSPYLASKVCGEAYCKAFADSYGFNTHIIRFSNVYGPCSEYKDSIIAKYIKAAINKETFYVYGSGGQKRDFIYVDDVVRCIIDGLSDASTGRLTSITSLVAMLSDISKELLGYIPEIEHVPSVPGEINNIKESPTSTHTPLESGLHETFKWFIARYTDAS